MSDASAIAIVAEQLIARIPAFFRAIGAYELKKAEDILMQKSPATKLPVWSECTEPLLQLRECERQYNALQFLEYSFFRKDSLKQNYMALPASFKLIVGVCRRIVRPHHDSQQEATNARVESCVQLLQETVSLVQARLALIELYRSLNAFDKPICKFDEMRANINRLLTSYGKCFKHPDIQALAENIIIELDALQQLFDIQIKISDYRYMDSVFALTLYKQMMNQWTAKRESSAEWQSNAPLILRWLQSLFASLLAKQSLYFFPILRERAVEMKENLLAQLNRLSHNYIVSIEQFAIRANASNICLLFEAGDVHYPVGVADPLTGMLGYHTPADPDPALCPAMSLDAAVDAQPGIAFEPPRGLRSFPAIFSYPIDQPAPAGDWPNVVSLLLDPLHARTLSQSSIDDACVWHVDSNQRSGTSVSYIIQRVEPRVLLLLVFRRAMKRGNETFVSDFCRALTQRLRLLPLLKDIKSAV